MSGGVVWVLVGLALAVVTVRRRSAAIALVTAQSALLGVGAFALTPGRSTEFLVASLALVAKAAVLATLLGWSLSGTREPHPVWDDSPPILRFGLAATLALGVSALIPSIGLVERSSEQATVALVSIGIATVVLRRATLFQVLGLIVAENGIALAATAVEGGMPLVIELGALFDVIVVIAVATAFHERIFDELGSGDTHGLRGLRD